MSSFRFLLPLCALSLFHCTQENLEEESCADVIEHIDSQCFYDDTFHESPGCAPEDIDLQLQEACNSVDTNLKSDGICIFGFGSGCRGTNSSTAPLQSDCSDYLDFEGVHACDYYRCKEAEVSEREQCGDSGYYLGYGLKYCQRFQESTRQHLSPAGTQWIDSVMTCLMGTIEDEVTPEQSCQEVKSTAFDAHPDCYVQTGFCELSWNDKAWVFFTVDRTDIELRQIFVTGISCL